MVFAMNEIMGLNAKRPEPGTVALVGAPLADGQPLGGVDLGPDAMRAGGLEQVVKNLGWGFVDMGNTARPGPQPPYTSEDDPNYYGPELVENALANGEGVGNVHRMVKEAAKDDRFVLTVGGDHSIAAGSITALYQSRPDMAVVWIDAHGDCNTPDSSPSAHYHGMPLAHALGWFQKKVRGFEWCNEHLEKFGPLSDERCTLIALRDVDATERELLRKSGVHVFTMHDIDRHGIGAIMQAALDRVDPKGVRPLHLSFDVDACDPLVIPGTGTKAKGGLTYREAHYICETMAITGRLKSMDLVEVNPALDKEEAPEVLHGDDPTITGCETVRVAIELVASALGKTIV